MWVNMAYELMYRFTQKSSVGVLSVKLFSLQLTFQKQDHIKQIQLTNERLPAFAIAEIAFLVSLTSADTNVTLTAAHCLRLLAQAETMPNAPITTSLSEDERVKRYPIYEQLGDPKIMIVGTSLFLLAQMLFS